MATESTQALIDKLRERVTDLEEQKRDAERRVNNWRESHNIAMRENALLKTENGDLLARVTELEGDINPDTGRYREVERLEEDRDALDRVNASLIEENAHLRRLRSDVTAPFGAEYWRRMAGERTDRIQHLNEQVLDLKQKLEELATKRATDLAEKNARIRALEQDNNNLAGELHGPHGPWAKLHQTQTEKRQLQEMLDAGYGHTVSQADELKSTIRDLKAEIADLNKRLAEGTGELLRQDQRIESLRTTLVQRTRERDEAKQRITRLTQTLTFEKNDHTRTVQKVEELERKLRVAEDSLIKHRGVSGASNPLVKRWKDGLERQAVQAVELGDFPKAATNNTISIVLGMILRGEELPSK